MNIRKLLSFVEEVRSEAGIAAEIPLRKAAAVAIVANPFAGRYQQGLSSLVEASEALGRELSEMASALLKPYSPESYGKGGVVGLNGEQEHAVALLTTVFGNEVRRAAGGGSAWISSMTKRAAPGDIIDVPLAYKDALYVRSHYDGMTLRLPDSPLPDEIAVICVYANRGRLNSRVGGLGKADATGLAGLTYQ